MSAELAATVNELAKELLRTQKAINNHQEVVHVALNTSRLIMEDLAAGITALEPALQRIDVLESKVKTLEGDSSLKLP